MPIHKLLFGIKVFRQSTFLYEKNYSSTLIMDKKLKEILIGLPLVFMLISGMAEEVSKEQIKGLAEQVQDIKKDVLSISKELSQLEEKLLFPSNTQVSLFISLARSEKYQLHHMNIKIDGKYAIHHIYTSKEREALQNGGVQRIYTGNIKEGEHILDVTLTGKSDNTEYPQNASHVFTKAAEPKLIEITLVGTNTGKQTIGFKD